MVLVANLKPGPVRVAFMRAGAGKPVATPATLHQSLQSAAAVVAAADTLQAHAAPDLTAHQEWQAQSNKRVQHHHGARMVLRRLAVLHL